MLENKGRTELNELGEFGLIEHLTKKIKLTHKSSVKGVGDDAAVIDPGTDQMVVTTDLLTEGVHFDLMYAPLKHLGYKAAVVNFSDIYAMNATPKQITVSIAVSNRFSLEAIEEIYNGIYKACGNYGVDLVGGDTSSSLSGLTISITAIGAVEQNRLVCRDTAKEGDLLCVSGDLGSAYVGLQLLEREKQIFKENPKIQPDLSGNDYVLERQLKPEARMDIIHALKKEEILPSSMIDISDGLASETLHLCHQSNLGCNLYEEKIPVDPISVNTMEELNLDPTICALSGGEDYELLFTISPGDHEKIKKMKAISVIGHMTAEGSGNYMINKTGSAIELTAQGWDAFLKKKKE